MCHKDGPVLVGKVSCRWPLSQASPCGGRPHIPLPADAVRKLTGRRDCELTPVVTAMKNIQVTDRDNCMRVIALRVSTFSATTLASTLIAISLHPLWRQYSLQTLCIVGRSRMHCCTAALVFVACNAFGAERTGIRISWCCQGSNTILPWCC